MNIPKTQKKYCIFCKKHTEHIVEEAKRRPRKQASRSQRRFMRKLKGYGSFPRENPKGREKPTRKIDIRYKCKDCGKRYSIGEGYRIKKIEWESEQNKQTKAQKGAAAEAAQSAR